MILIKFPSRNRADKFNHAINKYIEYSETKNICFSFSIDEDDYDYEKYLNIINKIKHKSVTHVSNGNTKIEAVNRGVCDDVIRFNPSVILLASDDMIPIRKRYDKIILDKFKNDYSKVLWFHDGTQRRLNTLSIIGIEYFKMFNYIYHPSYKSLWCDNEFHDIALSLRKMNDVPYECIIEHRHPSHMTGICTDALYNKNEKFWNEDKLNYLKRKANGFVNIDMHNTREKK